MIAARIPHAQLPGTSQLFQDLIGDFEKVERFYAHRPSVDAAVETAKEIDYPADRRAAIVAALEAQNASAGEATRQHLELLKQPDTVVIATGQQVGFLGGPVFSIYKALTAAKLAATLRDRATPAVAVFWTATEDHDLPEVDHAWLFGGSGEPRRLDSLAKAPESSPAGNAKLTADWTPALEEGLSGLPFGSQVAQRVGRHYRADRTLGQAFRGLLEDLLSDYGLIFLNPMDPAIRAVGGELLQAAVGRAGGLIDALEQRGAELDAAGYHQQVAVNGTSSLLFRISASSRTPIRRSGDTYLVDGESLSPTELAEKIAKEPEGFSPNALLRPVLQDHLLPTAAFVGGAAELAYLAQSSVIYKALLGRMPVAVPRAAFTLLDSRAAKQWSKYGLGLADCLRPRAELRQKIADRLTPPELAERFDRQGEVIGGALDAISEGLQDFDPTLNEAFGRSRAKIEYQLAKTRAKASRESLRRDERSRGDAERLANLINPEKTLQERLYGPLPFLAQHGDRLLEELYDAIDLDAPEHRVLAL